MGGRRETMALVTIALPCPPPPEPLSPLTSAPSKHNSETLGGWVGGSVQSGHYPQQGVPVGLVGSVLFWLLENKHKARQIQMLFLSFICWEIPKNAPTSPQLFLFYWVCEHEWNLPGSAQVGPGLPLLVWDGPL